MFAREPTRELVEPHVREWAGRLAGAWAQSGVVDVERELTAATMQIAEKSLFGVDVADGEAAAADVRTVLGEFRLVTSARTRAVDALRMRRGLRFVRAWERLAVVGGDLVAGPGPVAEALRGVELDDDARLSEARNIMLAGTETTSTALTWALLELARAPSLADSLAEEGEPLAERVFAETLRLYPPAWYIARLAVADVELAGERIAEGTMALVSPYLLHRDARHYERPEQFEPERWRDGTAAAARAFTFLPFGAGTRRCIGEEIAWLEGRVILAELARSLVLEAVGDPIAPSPAASLRPASPVVVRVRRRP
jgi:cytochrome P450